MKTKAEPQHPHGSCYVTSLLCGFKRCSSQADRCVMPLLKNTDNLETFSFQIFKYLPFMAIFPSHVLLLHICN